MVAESVSTSRGGLVANVVGRLRSPARVQYLGVDPTVAESPVRLCLTGLDFDQLVEIAGTEAAQSVRGALAEIAAPATFTVINLDPAGRSSPSASSPGLDRRAQVEGRMPERRLFEDLVLRGFWSPAAADALAGWPGRTVSVLDHEIWPSLLRRRVNHVKLRVEAGRISEAKAYLCFEHTFIPRGNRRAAQDGPVRAQT